MKDKKIKINGIDLHLVDFGGTGETIICIHGLTANSRYWDSVAERLIDSYRVLAIDLRGRGDSTKPASGYNIRQHVEDILQVLDFLKLEKVIYMGHSLGALIGVSFAATYPQRLSRLILVDGGANVDEQVFEKIRPAIDRLDMVFPDFTTYLNEMKKNPLFSEWNEYVEQYFYADVEHRFDGSVCSKVCKKAIIEELNMLKQTAIDEFYEHINIPTLLLWAPDSFGDGKTFMVTKEKWRQLTSSLSHSYFVEIDNANHYSIILSKYEQLVDEVKKFLQDTKNICFQN
ncbi:alpha/beta fold hydrolase [Geobacillus sp. C56-T2]|uniref:alpha/beta fold hydrolase n=1 Tax=Geobacillus sp. C56-T2 TaxID=600773 RepID=UPI0011AAD499|nr:alpha/beta hydrolase [Geobacillus sp. C56-T2]NNV07807.1 alpha/beta hydrolase [Geobacillus sp. MMMUD3]TWG30763.1 pimeloyl-ACP methyl ester carboxylesterase [Geobacillus sp. C56-T2]